MEVKVKVKVQVDVCMVCTVRRIDECKSHAQALLAFADNKCGGCECTIQYRQYLRYAPSISVEPANPSCLDMFWLGVSSQSKGNFIK